MESLKEEFSSSVEIFQKLTGSKHISLLTKDSKQLLGKRKSPEVEERKELEADDGIV